MRGLVTARQSNRSGAASVYLRGSRAGARARIAGVEGSPFVWVFLGPPLGSRLLSIRRRLSGKLGDSPEEAGQLTSDGDSCHCRSFVPVDHSTELSMQPHFGFLGDTHDLGWQVLPPPPEGCADSR